jgi:hypothetical protein
MARVQSEALMQWSRFGWARVATAVLAGVALAGVIGWRLSLQALERRIVEKRAAVKKLRMTGGAPPSQHVKDYLTQRQAALDARYQQWLAATTIPPLSDAARTDPQLYFQEQFHEAQRTIERLASARGTAIPVQLGFPKELPPTDAVPRLLGQLTLIQEAVGLVLEQRAAGVSACKVEDPETVPEGESGQTFLMRLPVRITFTSSLPNLMRMLAAIERVRPIIDVRSLRLLPTAHGPPDAAQAGAAEARPAATERGTLDGEIVLARYLLLETAAEEAPPADDPPAPDDAPRQARKPQKDNAAAREQAR